VEQSSLGDSFFSTDIIVLSQKKKNIGTVPSEYINLLLFLQKIESHYLFLKKKIIDIFFYL
jgi:hypothetical protein